MLFLLIANARFLKSATALQPTFLLAEGGALLFRPPTTAADLFTNAKVNY
jgi:hypothetical protein